MKAPKATQRRSIFVVDDNVQLLRVLRHKLEMDGFEVFTSETGDEAAEFLKSGATPDILLSDCVMPGEIQGWELAKVAKATRSSMTVILMSGYVENGDLKATDTSDFDYFLTKPLKITELSTQLGALLSRPVG